jgi:hypothetical protein
VIYHTLMEQNIWSDYYLKKKIVDNKNKINKLIDFQIVNFKKLDI